MTMSRYAFLLKQFYKLSVFLLTATSFLAEVQALPEDAEQPILGTYDNSLLLLDEGKQVFYGSPQTPAEITQGTLKISGQEITIERIDGQVKKITVIGSPAQFQQQPAIEQAIVTAEATTIILDYDSQHLSVEENARFSQGNDLMTGCHIDYYLESKQLSAPSCENGEQGKYLISPKNGQ